MILRDLAYYAQQAVAEDSHRVAERFLQHCDDTDRPFLDILLRIALWRDSEVRSFEAEGQRYLLETRYGRFWFASADQETGGTEPHLSPLGLVRLARGLVDVLTQNN